MAHEHANPERNVLTVSNALTGLAIGAAVATAGVVLAPHILPALGITDPVLTADAMWASHGHEASEIFSITQAGSGVAGMLNRAMASYLPIVGETLASNNLINGVVTASIGVGGMVLGNFIAKNEDGSKSIKWGNVIKYGAMATSALIALPMLLSGITMGATFLAMLSESQPFVEGVANFMQSTAGVSGAPMATSFFGLSGIASVVPHLFTCAASLLPAALSLTELYEVEHRSAASRIQENAYTDGSIQADIELDGLLAKGQAVTGRITLTHTNTDKPLTANELAVVHAEKLHLLITDDSLKDYVHVHPRPTGTPGVFEFSFTPSTDNHYNAWADFTVAATKKNHQLKVDVPSTMGRDISPAIRMSQHAEADGLTFDWVNKEPLQQGKSAIVEVNIKDAAGNTVSDLQPIMGAYAHLIGFGADGNSLVHCHPLGEEPVSADQRGSGKLRFHVEPDHAGATQFYLQIHRNGKETTVPFGQRIKSPDKAMERLQAMHQHSHGMSRGYGL